MRVAKATRTFSTNSSRFKTAENGINKRALSRIENGTIARKTERAFGSINGGRSRNAWISHSQTMIQATPVVTLLSRPIVPSKAKSKATEKGREKTFSASGGVSMSARVLT